MSERQGKREISTENKLRNYWPSILRQPSLIKDLTEEPEETITRLWGKLSSSTDVGEAEFKDSLVEKLDNDSRRIDNEITNLQGEITVLEERKADLQAIRNNFAPRGQIE